MSGRDTTEVMQDKFAASNTAKFDNSTTSDLLGMKGLGSHIDKMKEEEEKNRPPTKWERKVKRIFGEASVLKRSFLMGFMMGGGVGCLMGGLTGAYFAYQYKQFMLFPMMALSSGVSFGFFMGIGAVMRSGEMK